MGYTPETFELDRNRMDAAKQRLSEFRLKFDSMLSDTFNRVIQQVKEIHPETARIMQDGAEFALRDGKRLRPAFMCFAYLGFGGANEEEIIKASAAVELFHAGALVHDDIIDHSDLRRNKPTVHKIASERFQDEEIGEGVAIIAGNILVTFAGSLLSNFPDSSSQGKIIARQLYDIMGIEVNLGQYLDLMGNIMSDVDLDWVMKVMEYKTARYTIEKPLLIGASLAGASEKDLEVLSQYAIPLGIAFQIKDDLLGMFGDEKKIGKPVDSDLKEGKKTILVIKTLDKLRDSKRYFDIKKLQSILGNSNLSLEDYKWIQDIMVETGVVDEANELIVSLTQSAKSNLLESSISPDMKDLLLGIADSMVKRET